VHVATDEPVLLAPTLLGGQSFRFRAIGDAFAGVVEGDLWTLATAPGGLAWTSARRRGRARLARYLGLDGSYPAALERLSQDPVLAPVVARHAGLRVLRQEPWETLVAFVTSANNHVPRIEGILARLAEAAGEPRDDGEVPYHAFPDADAVARLGERRLVSLGFGYRAPYVRATARAVARGDCDLEALREASCGEAREALLALPGVGPKVADCVALFGLGHGEAFPVDRWIARAVADRFFEAGEAPRDLKAFALARWGSDAGLAQQFLFHAARVEGAHGRRAPGASRLASSAAP